MEEVKDYVLKVDLRKFYQSIDTEQLRALRDDISEELKARAREARKNAVRPKPEFRYWTGKITRRTGDVFSRYRFSVEPTDVKQLPEVVRENAATKFFSLMSGAFKKDTCPKIGEAVILKYRVLKKSSTMIDFLSSRIIGRVPSAVTGCKRDWNCLNIIAYDDKSQCPNCPDAIKSNLINI